MTAPFPHSQLSVGPPDDEIQPLSAAPVTISIFPAPSSITKEPRRSGYISNVFRSRTSLYETTQCLPPTCHHFLLSQAAAHTAPYSTSTSSPVVLVGAAPFLSAILTNSAPPPFDLPSFIAYSRKQYAAELPECYLAVQAFRKCSDSQHYEEEAKWILDTFVCEKAERQVNVPVKTQREAILKATNGNRQAFDALLSEVFGLMASDVYPKFLAATTLARRQTLARQEALWFRHPFRVTFKSFFRFPNPVNETDSRCHNMCTLLLVVAGCLLHQFGFAAGKWLLVYVGYGFLARMSCGSRLDPQAFFVLFVLSPTVTYLSRATPRFSPGPPKRFAQFCGLMFSIAGLCLIFTHNNYAAYATYGVLVFFAFLAGVFNICVACYVIEFLASRRLLPEGVCSDCQAEYCALPRPVGDASHRVGPRAGPMGV